jgi:hypothetical protein
MSWVGVTILVMEWPWKLVMEWHSSFSNLRATTALLQQQQAQLQYIFNLFHIISYYLLLLYILYNYYIILKHQLIKQWCSLNRKDDASFMIHCLWQALIAQKLHHDKQCTLLLQPWKLLALTLRSWHYPQVLPTEHGRQLGYPRRKRTENISCQIPINRSFSWKIITGHWWVPGRQDANCIRSECWKTIGHS